ncbi:LysE family translocator [Thioclava sp. BHET1]|uniref:Membrane protein n=1 Tax=Thioclava dalianensis TaxID=1185766 RepID=A0A074TMQ8_9RHOB|nr:LysE family translocator [Thioclava dalianensis]KEP70233.1 membrane protein [Thioclava dalianensis]TMV90458.1 LysE family translocator [Thioclava sp. BHET1]SFM82544.1 Threonine/homoserine/homoserine lactone efflux protein [Thioclava dalianensis]
MTLQLLLSLLGFAFVAAITPGPNNIMLMNSGATFGFRASVPHMLGVALGHALMVVLIALGIGELFVRFPTLHSWLTIVAALYLCWLAWKIARSGAPGQSGKAHPFSFLQAAAFQWVNPKAWAMTLSAVTLYGLLGAPVMGATFLMVDLVAVTVWAALGQGLSRWLGTGARLRAFNIVMALLLISSLGLVFLEG